MYLRIASFDPLAIPSIVPEDTLLIIQCMIFATLNAAGSMGTGDSCCSRGNRGVSLQIALAATSKGTMMTFKMGLIAKWAPIGSRLTKALVMSPFPTLLKEGGTNMTSSQNSEPQGSNLKRK